VTELSVDTNRVLTAADVRLTMSDTDYLEQFPVDAILELGKKTV
jgi:hypothetical protein